MRHFRPAARNRPDGQQQSDDGPGNVNGKLRDVGPDNGRKPPFKCIEQGEGGDDQDSGQDTCPENYFDDDGDRKNPDPFRQGTAAQEQASREDLEPVPKTALDQLISSVKFAGKVFWNKDKADNDARHQVSKDKLQKTHVTGVGNSRSADNGENAGLGGNDGQGNGPPGKLAAAQKIIVERLLALAETCAQQRDHHQIDDDNDQVDPTECQSRLAESDLPAGCIVQSFAPRSSCRKKAGKKTRGIRRSESKELAPGCQEEPRGTRSDRRRKLLQIVLEAAMELEEEVESELKG